MYNIKINTKGPNATNINFKLSIQLSLTKLSLKK